MSGACLALVRDIQRNPFDGIGKPEPLKSVDTTIDA
ncbi:type II toxin-antitoxin system YoeB family toxin [Candidatus Woesearchaeota archaeon]|nr:type II toxin-antitoxin system YoeB family toxin [Candidatus Woesearchaeota archaeon]